jgi:uncharacterized protein (TIGR03663 family)
MMHGPFQIIVTAGLFLLFGVSNFTTRLLPAVLGSAIVALPYFLRQELGRIGALFAAAVLTISPSFLYFSRFYRNDIDVAFFTLGIIVCFWRFVSERRPRDAVLVFAFGALSFTAKENTYITAFIFGTWLIGAIIHDILVNEERRALLPALSTVSPRLFLVCATVFLIIFAFFFTTVFTYWQGFIDGFTKSLTYWLGQQPVARGGEPWWYYFSLLLPYEPLTCVLAVAGAILALRHRSVFDSFLLWYAVMSLAIYSWAGEKMPWLILHPLLPLVLLAATAFEAFWQARWDLAKGAAWIGIAIGALYMVHSAVLLSYDHPADPREMLVYTQTSPDVLAAMRQIHEVGLRMDQGRSLPILIDPQDWWPFIWYLRNYTNVTSGVPASPTSNIPVIIVSDTNIAQVAPLLRANYLEEHFKLRWWWVVDWKQQSLHNWWNWLLYRKNWNPRGSTDFYLFIRRDVAYGLQW